MSVETFPVAQTPLTPYLGKFLGSDADNEPGGVLVADVTVKFDEYQGVPRVKLVLGGRATLAFATDKALDGGEALDVPLYVEEEYDFTKEDTQRTVDKLNRMFGIKDPLIPTEDEWERFFEDHPRSVHGEVQNKRVLFQVSKGKLPKLNKNNVMEWPVYGNFFAPYGVIVSTKAGGLEAARAQRKKQLAGKKAPAKEFALGGTAGGEGGDKF